MTWLAVLRSGTGSAISRAAIWMQSVITAAESNSVPSQSKTMRSYFLVKAAEVGLAKCKHIRWQRGFQLQFLPVRRMHESEPRGMQEKALDALPGERAIELEVTVL